MPTLTIARNYSDGSVLTEAMLDAQNDSIETFLNATKLDSTNIQSGGVAGSNIAPASIDSTKLALNAVTTNAIVDNAVTTSKIPNSAVTTPKVVDGAITQAKLASRATGATVGVGGVAVSASSGNFFSTSSTPVTVTNLSVTLTTSGRPVFVGLNPDGTVNGNASSLYINNVSSGGFFRILRNGSIISHCSLSTIAGSIVTVPSCALSTLDIVSAGTYTYTIQIYTGGSSTVGIPFSLLIAYEI